MARHWQPIRTLPRTCATAPRRGPLPKLLLTYLFSNKCSLQVYRGVQSHVRPRGQVNTNIHKCLHTDILECNKASVQKCVIYHILHGLCAVVLLTRCRSFRWDLFISLILYFVNHLDKWPKHWTLSTPTSYRCTKWETQMYASLAVHL